MNSKTEFPDHQRIIEDIEDKQRNTVWPDAMINSKGVDEFLWKGSPDAPLVQRIEAWIFGSLFILIGLGWAAAAYERHWLPIAVLSIAWFLIGGKVFLNGFRKRRPQRSKET